MADVLVGEVCDTHDGTLLDGPDDFRVVSHPHTAHLVALIGVALLDILVIVFQFLYHEGTADNVNVMAKILLHLGILDTLFEQTEHIVLLNVPDAALVQCLQTYTLLFGLVGLHLVLFVLLHVLPYYL